METKEINQSDKEEKSGPGGLLANVSLLTTGGSSLQQFSNTDLQFTSTRNQSLPQSSAGAKGKIASKNVDGNINTSTPARPFALNKVVYGFDLSPVHSHEMPSALATTNQAHESIRDEPRNSNNSMHAELQDKLENDLFAETKSKAAPNFMQAPAVPSPHHSHISARSGEDAETMMSQVYSISSKSKPVKHHSSTSPKTSKSAKTSQRSPSYGSPRKTSSKLYSYVRGSGYGIASPWKSPVKLKTVDKKKSVVSKKKTKLKHEELLSETSLYYPTVDRPNNMAVDPSHFHSPPGETYKVTDLSSVIAQEEIARPSVADGAQESRSEPSSLPKRFQQDKLEKLEERCYALEEECSRLKAENEEMNRENFLLTAKLNKLIQVNESVDPLIKDSLNENSKEMEVSQLKKEILQQERLLNGYQQENEKLYGELSKFKTLHRENEEAMFSENLKLKNKVASLKEDLDEKEMIIKDKNQFLLDVKNTRPSLINRSAQTDQDSSQPPPARNSDNVIELKEKIVWFAENQAVLEEKCQRLETASDEISQLRLQVTVLKKEVEERKKHSKLKESKTIEDLRRQVKELESSLIKSQEKDHVKDLLHGDAEKHMLEERCKQLDLRLKDQEERFSLNIQSLRQVYKKMSSDYEDRVDALSKQLEVLKLHSFESKQIQQFQEQNKAIHHENAHLKLEVERLQGELLRERKMYLNKPSPQSKAKKKARSESTYFPDHFIDRNEAEIRTSATEKQPTDSVELTNNEKNELLKDISNWKNLYEQSRESFDKLKQQHEGEVEMLKNHHQRTLHEIGSSYALVEEKLKESQIKLSKFSVDLSSSRGREQALQLQIKNLLTELQETRRGSPNVALRHLEELQAQIRHLDFRQKSRENKLNQVVASSADEYLRAEIGALHNTISEKNVLLAKFQYELDSILQVLEAIQKERKT